MLGWYHGVAIGEPVTHKVGANQMKIEVSWGHEDLPTLEYHVKHNRRATDLSITELRLAGIELDQPLDPMRKHYTATGAECMAMKSAGI